MAETAPVPRLVVTDALGRRIVNIDKPLFSIGRRSETDLRLPGADISRVHAEITAENGTCIIRDKQSRFGTFVNGDRSPRRRSSTATRSGWGSRATPRSPSSSTTRRRRSRGARCRPPPSCGRWRRCSRGCAALGSGRVLDDVLALVLDSAIEVTGAERGFIMLANRRPGSSSSSWRARAARSRCRAGRSRPAGRFPEAVFSTGQLKIVEDLLDGDLAQIHTGTVALGLNVIASDQYIAIVLPARMFRVEFDRRGLLPVVLSRAVGNSGSVTSPLIPWNSCGAYMAAALGVPTLSYADSPSSAC